MYVGRRTRSPAVAERSRSYFSLVQFLCCTMNGVYRPLSGIVMVNMLRMTFLFQTWKFWGGKSEGYGRCREGLVEGCTVVQSCRCSYGLPIRLFGHLCSTTYGVAIGLFTEIWKNFGRWVWGVRGGVGGWKLSNRVHRRTLPIHLFRHFCWRTYRLATIYSVLDRQTDRQTDYTDYIIMPMHYMKWSQKATHR